MIDVLYLCEFPTLNGGERSLLSVLPDIRQAGYQVAVAAPPSGPLAEALAARQVPLISLELRNAQGVRFPQKEARAELRRLLAAHRPRLVHANSLSMSRLSGPVCLEAGLASIGHLRDMLKLKPAAVGDLNCHTRLLAVSKATRDYHVAQGLAADKTLTVYNGVDLEQFQPRPATGYLHWELGLPEQTPLVACIGQFILRKGQDTVAETAALVAAKFPQLHWVFIGQRHSKKAETVAFEQQVRDRFSTAPLVERGHFLGTRSDVPTLLHEFTLLVHLARQEPLGRVLLEAAAAELPVVSTEVGGSREIFGYETAPLVTADNSVAAAEAVMALLADPTARAQVAAKARQRAIERFDVADSASRLSSVYKSLTP